jgi:hypothetical protein
MKQPAFLISASGHARMVALVANITPPSGDLLVKMIAAPSYCAPSSSVAPRAAHPADRPP